jgi:hypothetical protein
MIAKPDAVRRERIEIRRLHKRMSGKSDGVGAEIIREQDEKIGRPSRFLREAVKRTQRRGCGDAEDKESRASNCRTSNVLLSS